MMLLWLLAVDDEHRSCQARHFFQAKVKLATYLVYGDGCSHTTLRTSYADLAVTGSGGSQ